MGGGDGDGAMGDEVMVMGGRVMSDGDGDG